MGATLHFAERLVWQSKCCYLTQHGKFAVYEAERSMPDSTHHSEPSPDPTADQWIDVAAVDAVPEAGAIEVVVKGEVIALFRCDGQLFALDGLCAHQGGPVAQGTLGKTDGGNHCVTCPWHGWQYELETGIQTINRQPLQRVFPVRQQGERIEVQLI